MGDPTQRHGPIAFFVRHLPVCVSVIGVGIIIAPLLLLPVIKWNVERSGLLTGGPVTYSQISMGFLPGGPTVSFLNFALACLLIGAAIQVAAICIALSRRRRR